VYGGGGVTPDYIVKQDTIGFLARKLRAKNAFWETADQIMKNRGKDIRAMYGTDMKRYLREFRVTDEDMSIMKNIAATKEVEWKADEYKQDEDYLRLAVKALIGRAVFNNNGYTAVMLTSDKQAKKAIELFPEAKKIAKIK